MIDINVKLKGNNFLATLSMLLVLLTAKSFIGHSFRPVSAH